MQCNSEKFQPVQIEFLTENREGVKATLPDRSQSPMDKTYLVSSQTP